MSEVEDFKSAVDKITRAAMSQEPVPRAEAEELVNSVYHSYRGDITELPAKNSLYEGEGDLVTFKKMPADALSSRIQAVAGAAGIVKALAFPVTSTKTFTDRISEEEIIIEYTDGIILPEGIKEEVRAFAALPIPLPLPFDEVSLESRKQELTDLADNPFDKTLITKAVRAFKFISFSLLLKELEGLIPGANALLKADPYAALVVKEKSNEWITQLALRLGLTPPVGLSPRPSGVKTALICDDCAYSGEQIFHHIHNIADYEGIENIVVLVPFMTQIAVEYLKSHEMAAKRGVKVTILTSPVRLIDYTDVLSPKEVARFEKLFDTRAKDGGRTLAFTAWKRPDSKSSPISFFRGVIKNPEDRTTKETSAPLSRPIVKPYAPASTDL